MRFSIFSLVIVGLLGLGLGSFVACSSQTEATVAEIKLPTIQCSSCVNTVSKALKAEKGVKDVQVDLRGKTAKVTYLTAQTDVSKLEVAVVKSGYAANKKQADPEAYETLAACCKVSEGH